MPITSASYSEREQRNRRGIVYGMKQSEDQAAGCHGAPSSPPRREPEVNRAENDRGRVAGHAPQLRIPRFYFQSVPGIASAGWTVALGFAILIG